MAFVFHLERFAVVTAATADVASNVDVGQEVHLDALQTIALAGFAAAAFHIEAEAAGFVAALARFGQHGVEIANGRENTGVGGRIRSGSAADGRLVDLDNFVDMFQTFDGIMLAGIVVGAVDFFGERTVEDIVDECRFSAAGYAGDDDETAKGKFDGDVFQIVFASAMDDQLLAVAVTPSRWRVDSDCTR